MSAAVQPLKGVVFDLDDTLYLERDYVRSGFREVARAVGRAGAAQPDEVFGHLWELFESGVRRDTFNHLFAKWPRLAGRFSVADLVAVYRVHAPEIRFMDGVAQLIEDLRRGGFKLGLISDGPLASQRAKADALGLSGKFDSVLLTDVWGAEYWKPHEHSFRLLMSEWRLSPQSMMYIADNPVKDFLAPRALGWRTVRLRTPGQQHFGVEPESPRHAADVEVEALTRLNAESIGSALSGVNPPRTREAFHPKVDLHEH